MEARLSWDRKQGDRRFYYTSVREGGRVRKKYVGRGQKAEDLAREVEERRVARQAERDARLAEQMRVAAAERRLRDLRNMVNLLVRVVLEGAGYHQHHRGEWRRRRNVNDGNADRGGTKPNGQPGPATNKKEDRVRTSTDSHSSAAGEGTAHGEAVRASQECV
jgi:hypothetical protein